VSSRPSGKPTSPPNGGYLQIRVAAIILDIFIIGSSTMAAYVIRFGFVGVVQEKYLYQLMLLVPALIVARVAINELLGVYRVVWRYVGLPETLRFVRAVAMGSVIVSTLLLVVRYASATLHESLQIPLGIILLEGIFTFAGITVSRFLPRIVAEARTGRAGNGTQPTLLLGAGRGGLAIAREAVANPGLGIRPIGFLDDDPAKLGKEVHGLRVFGPIADMARVLRQTGATEVIITTSAIHARIIMAVMDQARPLRVRVRIVSNLFELLDASSWKRRTMASRRERGVPPCRNSTS
jgi:FlaA1/EpsC-like NDP-sugar epimerase